MNSPVPIIAETQRTFTKEQEERKREAYLLAHPALRWKSIMGAIDWIESNKPQHQRRNRPRQPHEK